MDEALLLNASYYNDGQAARKINVSKIFHFKTNYQLFHIEHVTHQSETTADSKADIKTSLPAVNALLANQKK